MNPATTGTTAFPQRALLLGVTWFPAAFLALWACAELGWWSARHMERWLAIFFAALFLVAFAWEAGIVLRAVAAFRAHPVSRVPINYLLLGVGVLTAVLAAGFAAVFAAFVFGT